MRANRFVYQITGNMKGLKIFKMILFYGLFEILLYLGGHLLITMYHTTPAYVGLGNAGLYMSIYAHGFLFMPFFIISDLWLHHKMTRLIALGIIALTYLISFGYYCYCAAHDFISSSHEFLLSPQEAKPVVLPDNERFGEFWMYIGAMALYLLLALGVSYILQRTKRAKK